MKVFKTRLEGYNGPIVVNKWESVILELQNLISEMSVGDVFTVTLDEMDEEEYSNLPEFTGY